MTTEQTIASRLRIWRGTLSLGAICLLLAGCSSANKLGSTIDPKYGVSASPRVVADGQPVPKGGGAYRIGKPYVIAGRTYVPAENPNYKAEGIASWYGDDFHGRLTANGEVFDRGSISAAHPTLPMPCYVRVTNLNNNHSIIVRVNDRGPYHQNRVIDVSHRTADLLGFSGKGVAKVRVEYVARAPLDGSDDRKLSASLSINEPAQVPSGSAVMVASATPFVPALPRAMPETSNAGSVPEPLQRPFDLGHEDGEEAAAPVRQAEAEAAPAPVQVRTAAVATPAPVRTAAVAPAPVPVAAQQRVAFQAQPVARSTAPSSGWSVGPAPVSGLSYAGVATDGSGR
ncbi:septal ring lytic transglycosylase RlpA family protein [Roseixanthobacter pseudopolyaromaticivorans]|uniref:septal ring lytic transglycosylase RlpA family protein n=1 Tax=Xanthobacteraceae TaxID=335928 RepID=UPI003728E932